MRIINSAVIVVGFNRPDYLQQQLDFFIENEYEFRHLEFVIDGPRDSCANDDIKQEEIRKIFEVYNQRIKFQYAIRNQNLGCKKNLQDVIISTFQKESNAIFLEDDCIPVVGFFEFMESALLQHELDPDVVHISGSNLICHNRNNNYFRSIFPAYWGWAGWSNKTVKYVCKNTYISEVKSLLKKSVNFEKMKLLEKIYWKLIFKNSLASSTVWDFEMTLNIIADNKFTIYPATNLVNNVGFRDDSTHMKHDEIPTYVIASEATEINFNNWVYCGDEPLSLVSRRNIVLYKFGFLNLMKLTAGSVYRYVFK